MSAGDRITIKVRAVAGNTRSPIASISAETKKNVQSTKRPTKVPSTDVPPTATLTATPEPSATSQTMFVETRNNLGANARTCPRTNCDILVTLRPDAIIQALGRVEGEEVYGSREWIQFEYQGETAFIHSELVEIKR